MSPSDLTELRRRANTLFTAGDYSQAASLYDSGYSQARKAGDLYQALRFLNNLAGCRFATFQYAAAMEAYLEARRLAESVGDYQVVGTASVNIASLYLHMSELEAAGLAAEQGLKIIEQHRRPDYPVAQLLMLLGRIRSLEGREHEARVAFDRAIEEAAAAGDMPLAARAWDAFGYSCLLAGNLAGAETGLTEAYRLRSLLKLKEITASLTNLALLRLKQKDLVSATHLSRRAIESSRQSVGGAPLWHVFHTRGLVEEARGELAAAFADFERAIDEARRWRLGVLPADALRTGSDVALSAIYSSYTGAGARLYLRTGRRELLARTFEAVEENRAASLRITYTAGQNWLRYLPPAYGENLARLRATESARMRQDSPGLRRTAEELRLHLLELEMRAGLRTVARPQRHLEACSLADIRRFLRPTEALVSFVVDEPDSFAWTITKDAVRLHRFAGRARLAELVTAFEGRLRSRGAGTAAEGNDLARELFFENRVELRGRSRWLIELDDALFRVPLAALSDPSSEGGRYVVEKHAIEIVPSALMLGRRAAAPAANGLFVGVGDPIYNAADERVRHVLKAHRRAGGLFAWLNAGEAPPDGRLELPRLAGSADEIRQSSFAWAGRDRMLLLGAEATKENLSRAVSRKPSVLHFATHVVRSAARPGDAMIAFGLGPGGDALFLDAAEIRLLRVPDALVVLSGCSSGAGPVLRGAGLMGLTRAWLLAGAASVVASHWPTPDDSGEFFVDFYKHLRSRPGDVATALQRAQLDMLRAPSGQASPSRWAAYFTYGKQ